MKTKYVIFTHMLDRDDYKFGSVPFYPTDERLQWLENRGITIETRSVYDVACMCYHIKVIAEFDRETYIEYRMVWE